MHQMLATTNAHHVLLGFTVQNKPQTTLIIYVPLVTIVHLVQKHQLTNLVLLVHSILYQEARMHPIVLAVLLDTTVKDMAAGTQQTFVMQDIIVQVVTAINDLSVINVNLGIIVQLDLQE